MVLSLTLPMTEPLRVDNLTVRFGDIAALDNVSHIFNQGTATAIMGANGSGKTTLLESIASIRKITDGDIHGVPPHVSYVRQNVQDVWMPITVGNVIAMGRYRRLGMVRRFKTVDREHVLDAAERLDVCSIMHRRYNLLSGGQRQRVRIAQALASQPSLVMLDEPITGLDIPSQSLILETIQNCVSSGVTVIMTTHYLAEAHHCDSVVLLANKLIAAGTPSKVLTDEFLHKSCLLC